MNFLPLLLMQCSLLLCGAGPGAAGSIGNFGSATIVQGNGTNQGLTCGTAGSSTCNVAITIGAGDLVIISSGTLNGRTVTGVASGASCGTYKPIRGKDQNGVTNTASTTIEMGYIYPASACASPVVVTFSAATNDSVVTIADIPLTGGGVPVKDAYDSFINAAGVGSPFNGVPLICTGVNEFVFQQAFAVPTITAVAAPYNTNALFSGANNWIGVMGTSSVTNNSPSICPTPSWTGAANTQSALIGVAFGIGGSAEQDYMRTDFHSGSLGTNPTTTTLAADAVGYQGGGNTSHAGAWAGAGTETDLTYATDVSSGLPTCATLHLTGGGGPVNSCTGTTVLSLATSATPPTAAAVGWFPPPTQLYTDTIWVWLDPNLVTDASGQYTLGQISNGTDAAGINVVPNNSGNIPLEMEHNSSVCGSTFGVASGWHRITRSFNSTNGGAVSMVVYASDGVTALHTFSTASCVANTTTANIISANWPGRNGAESGINGRKIEFWDWVADPAGVQQFTSSY